MIVRWPADPERALVIGLIAMFAGLAAIAYILSFIDPDRKVDPALIAMATTAVGAAVTHLLVRNKRGGNGPGE